MNLKKATLLLKDVSLTKGDLKKLQGYISVLFRDQDLIHNHNKKGKVIYRYPLIQFKLIDQTPAIIALTETAIQTFLEIFLKLDHLEISKKIIPVNEKEMKIENVNLGYTGEAITYRFTSAWIALNQEKYRRYIKLDRGVQRNQITESSLIGNILSCYKGLDYILSDNERIKVSFDDLRETEVRLKGVPMLGFTGQFKVNCLLPDYIGLGKSVSRGFGTIKRI